MFGLGQQSLSFFITTLQGGGFTKRKGIGWIKAQPIIDRRDRVNRFEMVVLLVMLVALGLISWAVLIIIGVL